MKKVHINSSIQSYDILIGSGIRHHLKEDLIKSYSSILIITDTNVANLYGTDILYTSKEQSVFTEIVPAGEQSKSIETYYHLQTKAIEYGLDRKSLIVALGGGVVGDLAGFVAATFMRGIDFVQVPTTILAHDSSVGGKVAINHPLGKNLIGSFYPPVFVLYDTETLQSLPEREVRSGYAEIIKEAMLADATLLDQLLSVNLQQVTGDDLTYFLEKGIRIKAKIVEEDERETGKRMALNLGHTLGHALEAKIGYGVLTHGEAVAIGLLFALFVSEKELGTRLPTNRLKNWLRQNGYPLSISVDIIDDLVEFMKHDKKSINNQVQMILLRNVTEPVVRKIDEGKLKEYLSTFMTTEMKEVI
jgi:3-dehydroquinate synthase